MSRYIDADAIDIRAREGYNVDGVLYLPYRDIRKSLDTAPSIDIVRCKECTERDDDWCMYFGNIINPDDFCSYGEREGERWVNR